MKLARDFFCIGVACVLAICSGSASADPNCHGKFANPITDYCWSCTFPIGLGGSAKVKMDQDDNDWRSLWMTLASNRVCSTSPT